MNQPKGLPSIQEMTDQANDRWARKMISKRLLSVEEAAHYLSLSPRTIYNGTSRKSKTPFPVKPRRWGKRVLFDIADLNRFADGLPKDGTPAGDQ